VHLISETEKCDESCIKEVSLRTKIQNTHLRNISINIYKYIDHCHRTIVLDVYYLFTDINLWLKTKDQLDVTCYFISLLMSETC